MLIPLTRETFEQMIPVIATGPQYSYVWGKWRDFLRRLLISLVIVVTLWIIGLLMGKTGESLKLLLYFIGGLYWFWSPVYVASVRNNTYRRYPYAGFWRGKVLDVFITEELINEEQRANKFGELEIIENRERRINVEVGDREGFRVTIQAPIKRSYKPIARGQVAEMLILSKQPELERIDKITDIYLPQFDLWVGDYPFLRRDYFRVISSELGGNPNRDRPSRPPNAQVRKRLR
mgnify:CR=1 FL=1